MVATKYKMNYIYCRLTTADNLRFAGYCQQNMAINCNINYVSIKTLNMIIIIMMIIMTSQRKNESNNKFTNNSSNLTNKTSQLTNNSIDQPNNHNNS